MRQADAEMEDRRRHPLQRRASDRTPIGRIIGPIEYAFGTGDHVWAAELLERNPIVAWYGLSPERFGEIVSTLIREGVPCGGFVRMMAGMLGLVESAPGADALGAEPALGTDAGPGLEPASGGVPPGAAEMIVQTFMLRVAGRPVEALRISSELGQRIGTLQPFFAASPRWSLFSAVQHGLTAMLAGEPVEALRSFTQARLQPEQAELSFLVRDACVKSAVIEALYGDPERSRVLLEEADGIRRTESWAEALIDTDRKLVEALIEPDDAERLRRFDAIPLRTVGEMWPFYVEGLHWILRMAGKHGEVAHRLRMLEQMPFPRVEGQGISGSVLGLAAASNALVAGNLVEARQQIERADGSLPVTRLGAALVELAAAKPKKALQLVQDLHRRIHGMRTLEVWRFAVLAEAHFALDARDESREVLGFALDLPGGLREQEVLRFSRDVRAFAEAELEGWPRADAGESPDHGLFPRSGEALTDREFDVLRELASGRSREEIARSQFISMNTLKAHLRSIYRKLEARSRTAAVLEAERRGLI